VIIELKKIARVEELVAKVLEVIGRTGAADRVGLASFETNLLDEVSRRDPSLPLIGIAEDPTMIDAMLERPLAVLAVRADLVVQALERAPAGRLSG